MPSPQLAPLADEAPLTLPETQDVMQAALLHWRQEQERKPITPEISLAAALRSLPAVWIDGICIRLQLSLAGARRQKLAAISAQLHQPAGLRRTLAELPALSQAALRGLLERGGWLPAWRLAREYGDDRRDGWFWNEELPESPLGLLRVSGLLMVGQARQAGRRQRLAVIPADLRAPLAALLAEPGALQPDPARSRETLQQIRAALAAYQEQCAGWQPPLALGWLERYLSAHASSRCADELWTAWNDLSLVLFFLEHFGHEISQLDQLRDFHLSELVHEFMELKLDWPLGLAERRRLLATLGALFAWLAHEGLIAPELYARVAAAVRQVSAGRGQLRRIQRPRPRGGEVLLERQAGAERIRFTYNDLRLLITADAEFQGSLERLRQATATIVDGQRKRLRIEWLLLQDVSPLLAVIAMGTPELVERCRAWFYHEPLSEARAW